MEVRIFLILSLAAMGYAYPSMIFSDQMKCTYGERGSLTATCYNATPAYFKATTYRFDHLDETLRCLNCRLTNIEGNTFDISGNQLKVLDLHDSQIETMQPRAFMGLIFLKSLNLTENLIQTIVPATFTGVKKIETLDLSKNRILSLVDSGFAELEELRTLYLPQNQIQTISPKAFLNLTKLEHLDLSFNGISAVNVSFENLTNLQILDLSNNKINVLNGDGFYNLLQLNLLDLSWNSIHNLSFSMKPGNTLRTISLNHNQIDTLWFNMSHLDALEELSLEHNNINWISPTPFDSLFNLHRLRLAYNKLTKLMTGRFSGLPQLRDLNCSHNNIKEVLITGVFSMQNLHTLDLSYNSIEDLDYTGLISRVPSLSYLRLEDNPLPCGLEKEMEKHFEEDNFKFFLREELCVDKPLKKGWAKLEDNYIETNEGVKGADVAIFVLIAIILLSVGALFYLQFVFYRGMKVVGLERVASTVQLIDDDRKEEDRFEHLGL